MLKIMIAVEGEEEVEEEIDSCKTKRTGTTPMTTLLERADGLL